MGFKPIEQSETGGVLNTTPIPDLTADILKVSNAALDTLENLDTDNAADILATVVDILTDELATYRLETS